MPEAKKSGKAALRSLDGSRATGMCTYSTGSQGIDLEITMQMPGTTSPEAVLQFGTDREYLCRPPVPATGTIKCGEPGVMAIWVLDDGKPVLFGQIANGPFDRAEALRRLLEGQARPHDKQAQVKAAAIKLPAATAPVIPVVRPSYREPPAREPKPPFLLSEPKPGSSPQVEGGAVQSRVPGLQDATMQSKPSDSQTVRAMGIQQPVRAQAWPGYAPPLAIKRAPRPTPRPPVYSPLWDDVSVEFEKMLDSLPKTHPFNGSGENAEIAEVPSGGAVQCYIGSVMINGMKVFLQAVPARPYARPAGFDHSLVSRNGDCFWVKYFIQDS